MSLHIELWLALCARHYSYGIMACANIVMAYVAMAYIVTSYVVMAYVVMAYIAMTYIVMAYIGMAGLLHVRSAHVSTNPSTPT